LSTCDRPPSAARRDASNEHAFVSIQDMALFIPFGGFHHYSGGIFTTGRGKILPVALLEGRILPQNGHALAPKYLRGDIDNGGFGPFENLLPRKVPSSPQLQEKTTISNWQCVVRTPDVKSSWPLWVFIARYRRSTMANEEDLAAIRRFPVSFLCPSSMLSQHV